MLREESWGPFLPCPVAWLGGERLWGRGYVRGSGRSTLRACGGVHRGEDPRGTCVGTRAAGRGGARESLPGSAEARRAAAFPSGSERASSEIIRADASFLSSAVLLSPGLLASILSCSPVVRPQLLAAGRENRGDQKETG